MLPLTEIVRWLVQGSLVAILCIISVSDIKHRRIPNWAVLAIAGLFVPWTVVAGASSILSSLEAALIVLALSAAMYAFGLLGAGDSKLMTVCTLFVGMAELVQFLLFIAIAGGVLAIAMLSIQPTRALVLLQMRGRGLPDRGVPYGVAIAIAAICVVILPLSSMSMLSWMP